MNYTPYGCITQEKMRVLRTRGALTPYLKLGGCGAVLLKDANDLHEVFAILRAGWNIPPDVQPDMPLEELQKAMAERLPENWASREIMRMREE